MGRRLFYAALIAATTVILVATRLKLSKIGDEVAHFSFSATKSSNSDLLADVSFSDLKDALLTRYGASAPDVSNDFERLHDALMAMELVEQDGKPIGIKDHPYLYVGGAGAAYNFEGLEKGGITHIINLSPGTHLKFPGQFKYMHVKTVHSTKDRVTPYFDSTFDFIERARLEGGRVLVHGWKGTNRCVVIIMAYLMKQNGMSADAALNLIKETRPKANPCHGFLEELHEFETVLRQQHRESVVEKKMHGTKNFAKLAHILDKSTEN